MLESPGYDLAVIFMAGEGSFRIIYVERIIIAAVSYLVLFMMTVVRTATEAAGAVSDRCELAIAARVIFARLVDVRIVEGAVASSSIEVDTTGGAERHSSQKDGRTKLRERSLLDVPARDKHQAARLSIYSA